MSLEALVGDLDLLKAQQADTAAAAEEDANIAAAAGTGDDAAADGMSNNVDPEGDTTDDPAGTGEADEDDKDGEELMGKSFRVMLEDGSEVEAMDGAAMLKSLRGRFKALDNRFGVQDEVLQKAMGTVTDLLRGQSDLIKSLVDRVRSLEQSGRGRRAVVNVNERPDPAAAELAKSHSSAGMTPAELLQKAENAVSRGHLQWSDVVRAEAFLAKSLPLPDDLMARILHS